jgi:hypothetical protein
MSRAAARGVASTPTWPVSGLHDRALNRLTITPVYFASDVAARVQRIQEQELCEGEL